MADVENQDKQVKQFFEAVNITHTHTHTHIHKIIPCTLQVYVINSLLFSVLFYATFIEFTYTKSTLAITKTAVSICISLLNCIDF